MPLETKNKTGSLCLLPELGYGAAAIPQHTIAEKCIGCERVSVTNDKKYCQVFPNPEVKWRLGNCNMATHIKVETKGTDAKVRVGQQKQKKK
ncbi:MAG: PxxKW family cysteine-rich protein [Deltaproteobacteria bacterium]|jgi:hypothetical protein|nr:PxxKW family cysteine-rich protein [Deltaproteobacteria bacterium]